ncbi:MAG: hypothetical protein KME31_24755 [Tolypothrix carrinoi HA7290-LM1]|nr:hypothetical protein [Tolypothrix carrinoi HA7290-LM1]
MSTRVKLKVKSKKVSHCGGRVSTAVSKWRTRRAKVRFFYPLPITHYPLPITHYPLPITHYPLPITHFIFLPL